MEGGRGMEEVGSGLDDGQKSEMTVLNCLI